jgi:hypothetical protein
LEGEAAAVSAATGGQENTDKQTATATECVFFSLGQFWCYSQNGDRPQEDFSHIWLLVKYGNKI